MYKFINPYNFVPFGNEQPQKSDKNDVYRDEEKQKNLLSGWIDVNLLIKTPLIVPDGAHPKYSDLNGKKYLKEKTAVRKQNKDLHREYNFIQMYNPKTERKEYVVPGSELRGLIRSVYEAVTNSCVPFLMNDKPMSQRVPLYGALNRRGLLGYDGERWVLYDTNKELEEVIVVPVYEANGNYYVESLKKVKDYKENKDSEGNPKFAIMQSLDNVENCLQNFELNSKSINYGAEISKNQKKLDIKIHGQIKERQVDKNIHYLFIKSDGTAIKEKTASYIENKGWIQYNVPVDTSKVYHVAYLQKKSEEPIYKWEKSSAKGNNQTEKNDALKAEAYKKLKSVLDRDGTAECNTNEKCNRALKDALENACIKSEQLVPVYYFIVKNGNEELVYMSGSAAGRIAQRRKWEEIMDGHTPCEKELCPACLLFGTIRDGGMKGHVRFSDAYIDENFESKTSYHTLQVLSSPKATAFEFYLRKPDVNATYWNYDFYGVTESDDTDKRTHTNYYHLKKALPRGRKMYWHHKPAPDDKIKGNLNNTMECLDNGRFSFKVYFNQITKEQLKDLIWVITLGENNEDSNLQHKLGHAKPLGYGSVKLIVEGVKIRQFCKKESGEGFTLTLKDLSEIGIDKNHIKPTFDMNDEAVKSLLVMCNRNSTENNTVDYPRNENNKIYEWFSENRRNSKNLVILPEPNDKIIFLEKKQNCLEKGEIVEATFEQYAERKDDKYRFGVFVKLPGEVRALMHKKNAQKQNLGDYENCKFKVKIMEITEKKGKMQYSVTDKIILF